MNSRQRRGVILLLVSVLCAIGALGGVISVIDDANAKVGPEVTAYRVKSDVAPYTELKDSQFERTKMPKKWLSGNAVTDLSAIHGRIAVTQLKAGSLLQSDMIVQRPQLQPGEQEIAIMIDAATGVAGKIEAGSSVNIFATFAAGKQGDTPQSKIIVSGAKVLDVGKLTSLDPNRDDRNKSTEVVPITFALNTLDAQRVAYAESFAQHVRLALVAPGGDSTVRPGDRTYRLEKDQ